MIKSGWITILRLEYGTGEEIDMEERTISGLIEENKVLGDRYKVLGVECVKEDYIRYDAEDLKLGVKVWIYKSGSKPMTIFGDEWKKELRQYQQLGDRARILDSLYLEGEIYYVEEQGGKNSLRDYLERGELTEDDIETEISTQKIDADDVTEINSDKVDLKEKEEKQNHHYRNIGIAAGIFIVALLAFFVVGRFLSNHVKEQGVKDSDSSSKSEIIDANATSESNPDQSVYNPAYDFDTYFLPEATIGDGKYVDLSDTEFETSDLSFLADEKYAGTVGLNLSVTDFEKKNDKYLESLEGIENIADTLQWLDLSGNNEILDYIPLQKLEHLKVLNLYNTGYGAEYENLYVSRIRFLFDMQSLKVLSLKGNHIEDITFLSSANHIQVCDLSCNEELYDYTPIIEMNELQCLNIWGCGGFNFSFLENVHLKVFFMGENSTITNCEEIGKASEIENLSMNSCDNLSDISALVKLKKLKSLDLSGTEIENIAALRDLTDLFSLDLQGTKISDISPLEDLENLEYLNLGDLDKVIHWEVVKKFTSLKSIYLSGMDMENLDVLSGMSNLKVFVGNNLHKLKDISALRKMSLSYFRIYDTSLESLRGLESSRNLNQLIIENSPIKDISMLKKLKELTVLQISATNVKEFNCLKNLEKLEYLDLSNNISKDFTFLKDLVDLKQLEWLDLSNSSFSDISLLSGMKQLKDLRLWKTDITKKQSKKLEKMLPDCIVFSDYY